MLSDAQRELKPYRGALSHRQIARCMLAAMSNAKEWLEDAIALMARGSYRHAYVACIFATEEASKVVMLPPCCMMDHNAGQWWKRFWRRYRTHMSKHDSTWFHDFLTGRLDGVGDDESSATSYAMKQGHQNWAKHIYRLFACYSEVVEGEPFCPPDLTDPGFVWSHLAAAARYVTTTELHIADLDEDALTAINERMDIPKTHSDDELLDAVKARFGDKLKAGSPLESSRARDTTGELLNQRVRELWTQLPPEVQHQVKEALTERKDAPEDDDE